MINKMRHHPLVTNILLFFILMIMVYSISFSVSLWLLFLAIPVLSLYIFGFAWNEKYELVCPECHRTYWDKSSYYCNYCGVPMVFSKKEKIKKGEEPKPGKITVPCCSKGHEVLAYDKYCPKCGEQLKD